MFELVAVLEKPWALALIAGILTLGLKRTIWAPEAHETPRTMTQDLTAAAYVAGVVMASLWLYDYSRQAIREEILQEAF